MKCHCLSVLALAFGLLSGLPFRADRAVSAPPAASNDARLRDPFGNEIPRPRSEADQAVEILTTRDSFVLRRAFTRALPGELEDLGGPGIPAWFIAERWAEVDPAGMFEYLMATGGLSRETRTANVLRGFGKTLFSAWVKQDPEAALAAALALDRHPRYPDDDGLGIVMLHLLAHDPARAKMLADSNPTPVIAALRQAAQGETDRRPLLDFVAGLRSSPDQAEFLGNRIWEGILDENASGETWNWLRDQPEAILIIALELPLSAERAPMPVDILHTLRELAADHPEHANRFLSLRSGELIAAFGFAESFAWASDSLKGSIRKDALNALFDYSSQVELSQILAAHDSLPGGELRDSITATIATRMTADDPLGTLDWIKTQDVHGPPRYRAIDHWALEFANIPEAAEKVTAFVNSRAPDADSMTLLDRFFGRADSNEFEVIERLNNGQQAAEAARVYFLAWKERQGFETARAAANTLQRPAVREAALAAIKENEANPGDKGPDF